VNLIKEMKKDIVNSLMNKLDAFIKGIGRTTFSREVE